MIDNTERGVTLSRSLAWTMATGLVAAGLWTGAQIASLRAETEQATEALAEMRQVVATEAMRRDTLAERLRAAETGIARQDERLALILSKLTEVAAKLDRIEQQKR